MAPYPMDQKMEALTLKWLDEMKKKGFIKASDSAMTSPLFWVEKKVKEEFRPCQDYRHINSGTIPNAYPLPTISDLLLRLRGQKYFTKFDVRWGYNNVRIKEGDAWKAAFSDLRTEILYQIRCQMGLQQCTHQRRGRLESCVFRSEDRNTLPNSMSDGVTTMYASKKGTPGKLRFRLHLDPMNQPSCSLVYATVPPLFRR